MRRFCEQYIIFGLNYKLGQGQKDDRQCTISDIPFTMISDVRYTISDILYPMYDVRYPIFYIRCIRCRMYDIRHSISDVRFPMFFQSTEVPTERTMKEAQCFHLRAAVLFIKELEVARGRLEGMLGSTTTSDVVEALRFFVTVRSEVSCFNVSCFDVCVWFKFCVFGSIFFISFDGVFIILPLQFVCY